MESAKKDSDDNIDLNDMLAKIESNLDDCDE